MRKWFAAIVLFALLAPASAFPQAKSGKGDVYEQLNLFGEAFNRIRQDAVEPVGDGKLVVTAIAGMLAGLDPHSSYLSEIEYNALKQPGGDGAASPGLVITLDNGQLKVVSPRDGSPAAKAGVKPGDIIFSIDKEPTYDLTLSEAEHKLRGPAGSKVALTLRRGSGAPINVTLERRAGTLETVSARLEGGTIGYLRIAGFDDTTVTALTAAIEQIRHQAGGKLIGFVIDLRNNPGGGFDAAVAVADAFIDKGDIAIVKGRKPDSVKHVSAKPGDLAKGLPIVALVNGGTARETELVAAALQDNRRAVLLGTKTFGESSIESIIPLNGNGAIRLTTARFLTPSGRAIQGKGIDPDLNVAPLKLAKIAEADRRREADLRGALKNTDQGAAADAPGDAPDGAAAPDPEPGAKAPPAKGEAASVATGDIGTANDEQLSEALDVLRGLALASGRNGR